MSSKAIFTMPGWTISWVRRAFFSVRENQRIFFEFSWLSPKRSGWLHQKNKKNLNYLKYIRCIRNNWSSEFYTKSLRESSGVEVGPRSLQWLLSLPRFQRNLLSFGNCFKTRDVLCSDIPGGYEMLGIKWISQTFTWPRQLTNSLQTHGIALCNESCNSSLPNINWNFYQTKSIHGIITFIWLICMVNVGKYIIHGSYGFEAHFSNILISATT